MVCSAIGVADVICCLPLSTSTAATAAYTSAHDEEARAGVVHGVGDPIGDGERDQQQGEQRRDAPAADHPSALPRPSDLLLDLHLGQLHLGADELADVARHAAEQLTERLLGIDRLGGI